MEMIEEFFEIEYRNLQNPTILAREEHLTHLKSFDELAPGY